MTKNNSLAVEHGIGLVGKIGRGIPTGRSIYDGYLFAGFLLLYRAGLDTASGHRY